VYDYLGWMLESEYFGFQKMAVRIPAPRASTRYLLAVYKILHWDRALGIRP
jgi:hypothetical protein